jgi:hypothetical protein
MGGRSEVEHSLREAQYLLQLETLQNAQRWVQHVILGASLVKPGRRYVLLQVHRRNIEKSDTLIVHNG